MSHCQFVVFYGRSFDDVVDMKVEADQKSSANNLVSVGIIDLSRRQIRQTNYGAGAGKLSVVL